MSQKSSYMHMNVLPLKSFAAVTWLKYCRYGVKLHPINQSINQFKVNHAALTRTELSSRIKHFYLKMNIYFCVKTDLSRIQDK